MELKLFPFPRKIIIVDQKINLRNKQWVYIEESFSQLLKKHVNSWITSISDSFDCTPQLTFQQKRDGKTLLNIRLDMTKFSSQEYSLTADKKGFNIIAGDERGAFYALTTLKQIFKQTGTETPQLRISDFPDFDQRGMMLDISRCKVPTMDSLKKYIDILASLKFNQLQLYTEHTFAYFKHETVYFESSPMTAEEILEIDEYCARNYIELVPNFNSFGHLGRWLKHPEYRHLAECPDGFEFPWGGYSKHGGVLYPGTESLKFIDSLYKEFLPNFSSKLFNIGCDETWELGQGRSKKAAAKHGSEKIYFDFLLKLAILVKKHKRQMMFWGDIILKRPELIKELPKDIIALNWGYEADHPFKDECAKFAKAGVPFYVCPGTSSWNSLIGSYAKARKNLANAAENGLKFGAAGYLITDWGDGGHHQYLPISYPGILTGACFSWCFNANRDLDTAHALNFMIFNDNKEKLGQILLDISEIQHKIPVQKQNCSIFDRMLFFNNKEIKETFAGVSKKYFNQALFNLDKLKQKIYDSQVYTSDCLLVKNEISAGIEMVEFSLIRTMAVLWPKNADKIMLKHRLQHIIRIHEELWLARNRYGGLRESSDRLRAIFEQIECI